MKLALDSSQNFGSIALAEQGKLIYSSFFSISITHSETLMPQVDYALKFCGCKPSDLEAVYFSQGPGSFTGLRIGIATAKGLAESLGCSLVGVPSLDTLAHAAVPSYLPVMPVVDAKKGEVFCSRYDEHGSRFSGYMNLRPEEVVGLVGDETLFMGSG